MDENYSRVSFKTDPDGLGGGSPERLWAKRINPAGVHFELHNSPFYAKGVSYLDVVEASWDSGSPEEFQYIRTIKSSGHSTYRLLIDVNTGLSSFTRFWSQLERLGCTYEYSNEDVGRLYAVDVPPGADIFRVYRILQEGENESAWLFDEGHCGHSVIESRPNGGGA